jgi:hypothetical protein
MPENYVLLERTELNATAASVTFNNIPQTGYTDLKVVVSARTTRTGTDVDDELRITFNGTTSGYSTRMIEGNGSTTRSTSDSGSYFGRTTAPTDNATANTFGNSEIYIPNYAGSTNKSISIDTVMENNATTSFALLVAGLWSNTSAITSITITPIGTFDANSTFSLYGIAALGTTPVIAPKAIGGNVIDFDGTYWIHTFTSSGTFTPQVGLNCEYLVIAGGGGGSGPGGGGGAGGYRCNVSGESSGGGASAESSMTLTAGTSYGITVGAGGAGGRFSTTTSPTIGGNSVFNTITSTGGGRSGIPLSGLDAGGTGGSGGGGRRDGGGAGSGTANQGYNGGAGAASPFGGAGGGGGAGSVGSNGAGGSAGAEKGGNGGSGVSSSITGTSVARAGGGGGGAEGGLGGGTATAGGGAGSTGSTTPGTANTGGGGGGNGTTTVLGGNGGSGIVIIRYPAA